MKGKKYLLGLDVILSAGEQAITELQDSDEDVNEIYFDRESVPKELRADPAIKSFMKYAQGKAEKSDEQDHENKFEMPQRNEDGSYTVNGVKVFLKKPINLEGIIGITDDPETQENFYDSNLKVERPRFLLQNPKVLKNGLIKPKVDLNRNDLDELEKEYKDRIPSEIGFEAFDIHNPFINQFTKLELSDGTEAVYQLKQDVEPKGDGTYRHIGEPYFKRLLKNMHNFRGKGRFNEESHWGISPNSLNQYLALNHLLLDPSIELVVLTGGPGTGKTLIPYIAGLLQTLKRDPKTKSLYDGIYLSRPLTTASDDVGFLPGDLDEKLGPLYENFSGIHDHYISFSDNYSFDDALQKGNAMKLKSSGLYLPNERKPLIHMKNPGFMRGINIPNGWIMYDEFQNFTRKEAKLLLTRAAKGSKTIICGDLGQIDNYPINTEDKNGLVFATHFHMKLEHPHLGVMHFTEPDRNAISNYSSEMPTYYKG